jgi:hypothetical protein
MKPFFERGKNDKKCWKKRKKATARLFDPKTRSHFLPNGRTRHATPFTRNTLDLECPRSRAQVKVVGTGARPEEAVSASGQANQTRVLLHATSVTRLAVISFLFEKFLHPYIYNK